MGERVLELPGPSLLQRGRDGGGAGCGGGERVEVTGSSPTLDGREGSRVTRVISTPAGSRRRVELERG